MSASNRSAGKVAVVTGAGSGIGAATAARLAQDGAVVWLADIDAQAAGREAQRIGGRALQLDVTEPASWAACVQQVRAAGGWHILVNAAGIAGGEAVATAALDGWRRVFAVNVEGSLLGCQRAMEAMDGGAIVNVASTAGLSPSPALAAYGASKAAVVQLTASVAAACSSRGGRIRCNAVAPGMVETPLVAGMGAAYRQAWIEQIPAGRFADAAEVASVVAFLASDDASYVHGACYAVDGGLMARPVVKEMRAA